MTPVHTCKARGSREAGVLASRANDLYIRFVRGTLCRGARMRGFRALLHSLDASPPLPQQAAIPPTHLHRV